MGFNFPSRNDGLVSFREIIKQEHRSVSMCAHRATRGVITRRSVFLRVVIVTSGLSFKQAVTVNFA